MCSTGAATRLTVIPDMTPAIPWPNVGSVFKSGWLCVKGMYGRRPGLENTFSRRSRRYSVNDPSILNHIIRLASRCTFYRRGHPHRIHHHPSDQRWTCTLVKASHALFSHCLHGAIQRSPKVTILASLKSDFNCVEAVKKEHGQQV